MAKNQFSLMTPEERREHGRKGGIASVEARRRKKTMRETFELLLSMPMKKGKLADVEDIKNFAELNGKNVSVQTAMLIKAITNYLKTGDLSILEFIRDTVGDKPTDKIDFNGNVDIKNPYDELTVDELKALARKCESEES